MMTVSGTLLALFFTCLLLNFLFFSLWRTEKDRREEDRHHYQMDKLELQKRLNEKMVKIQQLEKGIEPNVFKYRTPRPIRKLGGKAE